MSAEKIRILGITGPSGCGKDTAARFIKNLYPGTFHYVTLCTTRPPRDKDENGYHFLLPNEFLQQVINIIFVILVFQIVAQEREKLLDN
jgi:guanylate kinase